MSTVIHLKITEQDCISKLHTMENKRYRKYNFCLQKACNLIEGLTTVAVWTSWGGGFFGGGALWLQGVDRSLLASRPLDAHSAPAV